MRVYDRKAFLQLPAGTIYAKGERWSFDGLEIKGASLENDWYHVDPAWVGANDSGEAIDRLEEMADADASYPMETAEGRDGYFDSDALFLVLERDDLLILRDWVDRALSLPSTDTASDKPEDAERGMAE